METKIGETCKRFAKRWFIDAFSGMAQGLFCTLIAGTILSLVSGWIENNFIANTLSSIATVAKMLMGAGIGVGIAHALKASKLTMFSALVAGFLGAFADKFVESGFAFDFTKAGMIPGNPIGAYVCALFAVEITSLYAGRTKLDIILVPLGMFALVFAGFYLAYPFILFIRLLGGWISVATSITPFFMGIIISVAMSIVHIMRTTWAALLITVWEG
ncbi:PTS sugar transporter subunit IIC, partial [uncultured Fibrobacter sp.]|uniref:PTS sugar transporter subunit IIC n=1 Tax=uncultured Fibrobacter sp. TaxID=261512 RepID=UPI0025D04BE4